MRNKVGLWLVGARGSVATTVSIGLCSLATDQISTNGLVSCLPHFSGLNLVDFGQIRVGGHEIRDTCLIDEAKKLASSTRAFDPQLIEACHDQLSKINSSIKPGVLANQGPAIERLASSRSFFHSELSGRELIEIVKQDLSDFVNEHELERLVVLNVASTEPKFDSSACPDDWSSFAKLLESKAAGEAKVPSSTLYAVAAFEAGHSYVNFTPSVGSNLLALKELAQNQNLCHVGQDGKTGETLVKSALAPMFAHRNLQVMSWVGHNIFGNMDAEVLNDPANKQNKVQSKDGLLSDILGYHPQSHISIENISSLGDWKTAWDHIHFKGFLGTPMVMQFIWQGCDSILAAPLVLDLLRFTERASRQGQSGVLEFLACFFKSPMRNCEEEKKDQALSIQFEELVKWAEQMLPLGGISEDH